MTNKQQILICDDHEIFRTGLAFLLESRERGIVTQSENAAGVTAELASRSYDVLVLDHNLPDTNGIKLLPDFRARYPALRIILLTGVQSGNLVRQAIDTGANAVIAKRGSGEELLEALDAPMDPPYVSEAFADDLKQSTVLDNLTKREREVLMALLDGLANKDIAEKLHVSFKTVDTHRTNVMRKLGVHSISELLAACRKLGLLSE